MRETGMIEEEWTACSDPHRMLGFLGEVMGRSKAGRRKVRLLLAACCRRVWHCFADSRGQKLIEASEFYADGSLSYRDFRQAWNGVFEAHGRGAEGAHMACMASHYQIWPAARDGWPRRLAGESVLNPPEKAHLTRDIFGPLLFRRLMIESCVLTRELRALAETAYTERALPSGHLDADHLAILSDALEDASCTERAVLDHLRSPGPHVRGCWVVDLILAKG
jgi:hypothetical protein